MIKPKFIAIRMTEEEKEVIEARAKNAHLPLSTFARYILFRSGGDDAIKA